MKHWIRQLLSVLRSLRGSTDFSSCFFFFFLIRILPFSTYKFLQLLFKLLIDFSFISDLPYFVTYSFPLGYLAVLGHPRCSWHLFWICQLSAQCLCLVRAQALSSSLCSILCLKLFESAFPPRYKSFVTPVWLTFEVFTQYCSGSLCHQGYWLHWDDMYRVPESGSHWPDRPFWLWEARSGWKPG